MVRLSYQFFLTSSFSWSYFWEHVYLFLNLIIIFFLPYLQKNMIALNYPYQMFFFFLTKILWMKLIIRFKIHLISSTNVLCFKFEIFIWPWQQISGIKLWLVLVDFNCVWKVYYLLFFLPYHVKSVVQRVIMIWRRWRLNMRRLCLWLLLWNEIKNLI